MLVRPYCNLTVGKIDEDAEIRSWLTNTKVYSLVHFLCSRRKERNSMKIESTALAGQKSNSISWLEKKNADRPWIFFLVFSCSSNVLFRWFSFHSWASGVWLFFGNHPKMKAETFGCLRIAVSSLQLTVYLVASGCQLPPFLFSLSWAHSKRISRLSLH